MVEGKCSKTHIQSCIIMHTSPQISTHFSYIQEVLLTRSSVEEPKWSEAWQSTGPQKAMMCKSYCLEGKCTISHYLTKQITCSHFPLLLTHTCTSLQRSSLGCGQFWAARRQQPTPQTDGGGGGWFIHTLVDMLAKRTHEWDDFLPCVLFSLILPLSLHWRVTACLLYGRDLVYWEGVEFDDCKTVMRKRISGMWGGGTTSTLLGCVASTEVWLACVRIQTSRSVCA